MTMSITIKSTHRLHIGNHIHDLTTEELLELRDQIDSALATRRGYLAEHWRKISEDLQPSKDWKLPPVTCDGNVDNAKFWAVHTSPCGPVNAAQTRIQP